MTKEEKVLSLVKHLNNMIFDDVLHTDSAVMLKIKIIELILSCDNELKLDLF